MRKLLIAHASFDHRIYYKQANRYVKRRKEPGFSTGCSYSDPTWYHTNHRIFFYDLTMINLESYLIQSVVNMEPKTSMVQAETIKGPVWNHEWPDYDQIAILNFCSKRGLTWHATYAEIFKH